MFPRLRQLGITLTPKTRYLTVSTTRGTLPSRWKWSRRRTSRRDRGYAPDQLGDPVRPNETFDATKASSNTGLTLIAFNTAPTLARGGSQPMHATQHVPMLPSRNPAARTISRTQARSRAVSGESDRMEPDFQLSSPAADIEARTGSERRVLGGDGSGQWAVGSESWTGFQRRTEDGASRKSQANNRSVITMLHLMPRLVRFWKQTRHLRKRGF